MSEAPTPAQGLDPFPGFRKGDLGRIDPKSDLELLRQFVAESVKADQDLGPFFAAIAARDPLALVELVTGPRTSAGPVLIRGALTVLDTLEQKVAPVGLYRRLLALSGDMALDVLKVAAERNPTASWLCALSDKSGEPEPGRIHLEATLGHPAFVNACWAHAQAGHLRALAGVAGSSRRPEPVAALLASGAEDLCFEVCVHLLNTSADTEETGAPGSIVTRLAPWIAGVWGPDLDAFFVRLVPRVRSRQAATGFMDAAQDWPRTQAFLKILLHGSHTWGAA